jgi:hypothetical protein
MSDPLNDSTHPLEATEATAAERAAVRRFRLMPWLKRGLFLIVLGLLVTVAYADQSERGQRALLDEIIVRSQGILAGELSIERVRTRTFLLGATLSGVRLNAAAGRRFLFADSVQLRYTPWGVLAARPRISSMVVWGLDLEISRLPSEGSLNIQSVLQPREALDDEADAQRVDQIRFGRIGVREGLVEILTPTSAGGRLPTVASPDGDGLLARLAFDSLDLDLEAVTVRLDGSGERLSGRLASLSAVASLLEEPLLIDEAFGQVAYDQNGIRVGGGAFRLPGSLLRGTISMGPEQPGEPWVLEAHLTTDGEGQLSDLGWLDPRIPVGTFTGTADLRVANGVEARLEDFSIQLEASALTANGTVRIDDVLRFDRLALTASPVTLDRLEPWIGKQAPLDGWLSGNMTVSGTLERATVSGRATFVPIGYRGAPTTADFSGTLFGGGNPGVAAFEARLNPVNYDLLRVVAPSLPLAGMGTLNFEVSGRVDEALRFVADATHSPDGRPRSAANVSGSFRRSSTGVWSTDLQGAMAPLSLEIFQDLMGPTMELRGDISGPWRAQGRLRDLQITADMETAGGRVLVDGVFDMSAPGAFYRFDAVADQIALSTFSPKLPEPSIWSGSVSIEGRGVRADSVDAAVTFRSSKARLGGLYVDTAIAHMRASEGIVTIVSLDAVVGGVHVTGEGRLGLGSPLDGEASLAFSTDSLGLLRPMFMGDTVIAKDTLSAMEVTLLAFEGVDVDALPDTLDVRMRGTVRGTVRLLGSLDNLDIELKADVRRAVYGPNSVDSATVTLNAKDLPGFDGAWKLAMDAFGLEWQGRSFEEVRVDGAMVARAGDAVVAVSRGLGESMQARGQFGFDSVGGHVALEEATLTIDSLAYTLALPTRLTWDATSLVVEDLDVVRGGSDPMRLTAAGTLSRVGSSDFGMIIEGLHIESMTRIGEFDEVSVSGHVDMEVSVEGSALDPVIRAQWSVLDPRLAALELSQVRGDLEYRDRVAQVTVEALSRDRRVFTANGSVPVDLALADIPDRTAPGQIDLTITADSLEASVALAYIGTLEDVEGWVTGAVRVRGTLDQLEPEGQVTLSNGGWSIEAVGVRHREVSGTLTLRPDRTVQVDLRTVATGASTVTGTITLDEISDPGLDIDMKFTAFQAVQRLDMEGRVSGDLKLTGRYGRPVVEGDLRVDQGTLFLDEFARNAGVVDLLDPRLLGADTTAFSGQGLLRGLRNPFLQNLSVRVNLSVPRDAWLRSNDMNVEMGGDLDVRYDRTQGDIVLVGSLSALRGSYAVLGRTFVVSGGTVGFIGVPGINPILDIQATSRIRRRDEEPFTVNANVEGTLAAPRVALSTDEAGLVQSDLISYLVFGGPSSDLAVGQSSALQGAAGSLATTYFSGMVASQLGAALTQRFGLDYLSITQAENNQGVASGLSSLVNTQVEIGQYVGQDAFIVLVFRRPSEQSGGKMIGGARLEWSLNDDYTVEGFFEDRFLRSGAGFGGLGFPSEQILGVFIFREWGY